MYEKTKVLICCVEETERLHRTVLALCAALWNGGAELRVRRVGESGTSEESINDGEGSNLLSELETIPPAIVEDLEWSDVALFVTSGSDSLEILPSCSAV